VQVNGQCYGYFPLLFDAVNAKNLAYIEVLGKEKAEAFGYLTDPPLEGEEG